MGLLAGSTVFLLTLLWGTCVIVGKCDIGPNGVAVDLQDNKGFSLTGTGISTDIQTSYAARLWDICSSLYHCSVPENVEDPPRTASSCLAGTYCHAQMEALGRLLNNDGTPNESVIKKLFTKIDIDGDKALSRAELHALSLRTRQEHDLLVDRSDEAVESVENPGWCIAKAVGLLLLGTAIAAAFADPLVMLKKQRTCSLTFSEVYGGVTMNNTLCLGVFLALIYVRNLTWDFSVRGARHSARLCHHGALYKLQNHIPALDLSSAYIAVPTFAGCCLHPRLHLRLVINKAFELLVLDATIVTV
ncbi:hypothetical protein GUJ93_ZPchr0001g29356 [Zizania palustris]|uniref:EF-hand domain-containing protein n=1 Tax=Zizania palustris TaxID=103762 RepID=A0A8J5VM64_ZIZPA|nr:hypothetical protein GUJ93_ZPchr0001g29356 [Zizania palustris]